MKIKRFTAATMREAMHQVRSTLSADAVILESRRTATGVEVVAAVDYDHLTPPDVLAAEMQEHAPAAPAPRYRAAGLVASKSARGVRPIAVGAALASVIPSADAGFSLAYRAAFSRIVSLTG